MNTRLTEAIVGLRSLGHPNMDSQHLQIFLALQRLDESLRGRFPLGDLEVRLRHLEALTLDHFRDEEFLMEKIGYPLLLPHRAEHERMIVRCRDLLGQYCAPDSPPLEQLAEDLIDMFLRHTEVVDQDYADFLER